MLKLRPYKGGDASLVTSWVRSEDDLCSWPAGGAGTFPISDEDFKSYTKKVSVDNHVFQMIAMDDRDPVGHVILSYPLEDYGVVLISGLLLTRSGWSLGFASGVIGIVLKYVFDILKTKKVYAIVSVNNEAAIKAYRSLGMIEVHDGDVPVSAPDTIVFGTYADMGNANPEENAIPEDKIIKEIINGNKLKYAFQPIIDASTGEIFGYEALMRADMNMNVSPMTILDYATRKKRLYDIEKLTFFNVLQLFSDNRDRFQGRKLFINSIPGYQLNEDDFDDISSRFGDCFGDMIVEITENTLFKDQELSELLERSSQGGFGLAIDDYGTGYSNTSSLLSYLPHYLKIDRLLISNIHAETKKQHFVKSIVEFAASNGVKTLAEGVETLAELKTAIDLGIDYIQGYFTAKPSLEIIDSIDSEIRNAIISTSVKGTNLEVRKIYTVEKEDELPVMRLALEKYTGILVERKSLTLVGNTDYPADMSVKIKDNTKCRLTIRDVYLDSIQHLPCIEIGTGSELTLVLEGENRMTKFGILVPESSKLIIEGDGYLQIKSQGVSSYAIGNFSDAGVGDIKWKGTGTLDIIVEADDGIGIGGGEFPEGCGIALSSGTVNIEPACGKAIALGAMKGEPKIRISDCKLGINVNIDRGVGIGAQEGVQNTKISSSTVNVLCTGNNVSAIGSPEDSPGKIGIEDSEVSIVAKGNMLYLMGAKAGSLNISFVNSAINLRGEGNNVLALGTKDMNSSIQARQVICNVRISSGTPMVYGAEPDNIQFSGGLQSVSVNE